MYERLGLDNIPLIIANPAITKCVQLAIAIGRLDSADNTSSKHPIKHCKSKVERTNNLH